MTEIRLRWNIEGRTDLLGHPIDGGLWMPDTPENRHNLEVMAEAGCYAYGEGTHWVEEREA